MARIEATIRHGKTWIVIRPRAWPHKTYATGKTKEQAQMFASTRWGKEHDKGITWDRMCRLGYFCRQVDVLYVPRSPRHHRRGGAG